MKTQYIILAIITILFIGFIIGAYLILVKPTIDIKESLEKVDPISKKQTTSLIGSSDMEGLKRAGVTDKEIDLILDTIANAIETADFEIIERYGITDEEILIIVQSDLFKSAWERVNIEKAKKAMDARVKQTIEEGKEAIEKQVEDEMGWKINSNDKPYVKPFECSQDCSFMIKLSEAQGKGKITIKGYDIPAGEYANRVNHVVGEKILESEGISADIIDKLNAPVCSYIELFYENGGTYGASCH